MKKLFFSLRRIVRSEISPQRGKRPDRDKMAVEMKYPRHRKRINVAGFQNLLRFTGRNMAACCVPDGTPVFAEIFVFYPYRLPMGGFKDLKIQKFVIYHSSVIQLFNDSFIQTTNEIPQFF